jgi:hypothetical protein
MQLIISRTRLSIEIDANDVDETDTRSLLSAGDRQAIQSVCIKLSSLQADVAPILPVLRTLTNLVDLSVMTEGVIRSIHSEGFLQSIVIRLMLACSALKILDLSQIKIRKDLSGMLMHQLHARQGSQLELIPPRWTEAKPIAKAVNSLSESTVLVGKEDEVNDPDAIDLVVDDEWVVPGGEFPEPPTERTVPVSNLS